MPDKVLPICHHAEFLADLNTGKQDWQLHSYAAAVRLGFGTSGTVKYFAAHAATLLPMVLFSMCAAYGNRYAWLAWTVLALLGYLAGNPGPTGIGMLWYMLLAVIGFVMSLLKPGVGHLIGGIIPGFSWLACCAVYGVTGMHLLERLRESPEYFEKLCAAGILVPSARLKGIENADGGSARV